MVGIYKITNKLNGKSYIGQSIHCGKRLDEHSKGSQFIDEIIQIEGIENFQFEILKEIDQTLLMNVIDRPVFNENFEKYAEEGELKIYLLSISLPILFP